MIRALRCLAALALAFWAMSIFAVSAFASAEGGKIGYVDMQKAIQETSVGKKAKKDLEKEVNAKKAEFQKREADLKKMDEDLRKKSAALSDEARGAKMQELQKKFPQGMGYVIPVDSTRFVTASIKEVKSTLIEAMVLVIAVVFLFLQSWRATLIPMVAVPISLIGTFAGLWLFGFSINTLTLFAMVLAIGLLADSVMGAE